MRKEWLIVSEGNRQKLAAETTSHLPLELHSRQENKNTRTRKERVYVEGEFKRRFN